MVVGHLIGHRFGRREGWQQRVSVQDQEEERAKIRALGYVQD